MKKLLILLFMCTYTCQIKAQNNRDSTLLNVSIAKSKLNNQEYLRLFAIKSMINVIDFDKLIKAPKGFAQLVSISIVFNNMGVIDTSIVTTKPNEHFELKKTLQQN
jgi:hypothetical protein